MTKESRDIYRALLKTLSTIELSVEWQQQQCELKKTLIEIEAAKRRYHLQKGPLNEQTKNSV